MPDSEEVILRRKMLGVKIRHARVKAGLNEKEIGAALGLTAELVTNIELGQYEPSLPQLEVLALLCNVPLVFFWSEKPLEKIDWDFPTLEALALRRRVIGVLLSQARVEAGRSQEDLAKLLETSTSQIASYELGKNDIPIQQLEKLATYLNVSLDYFIDEGLAPQRRNGRSVTLDELAQFSELPAEVRHFLLNPANLLYLNIAMRLSDLSADTLRNLAEGLLEVTY
jgi:transcriptional regulator with XRE-family HTH domain